MSRRVDQASSSAPFDEYRFITDVAQRHHNALVQSQRMIICELQFKPTARDGDIKRQLESLGWKKVAVQEGKANLTLVREFYANIMASNGDGTIQVRNKTVTYTAAAINAFYGLRSMDPDDYHPTLAEGPDYNAIIAEIGHPNSHWVYSAANADNPLHLIVSNNLNRYANAWSKFIRANLNPTSHKSQLTKERVFLLHCILTGKRIDIGRLIYANIMHACKYSTTCALPHPVLITKLCAKARVPVELSDVTVKQKILDSAAIQTIGQLPDTTPRDNGLGFNLSHPGAQFPPPVAPQPRVRRQGVSHDGDAEAQLQRRANERVRIRRDMPFGSGHHGASSSSIPPSHDADLPQREYSINDLGDMMHNLSMRLADRDGRRERRERRRDHVIADMQSRQLMHAQYIADYNSAYNHHHGYSAESTPPFPDFPASLLQPYHPPEESDEQAPWPAWQQ